MTVYFECIKSDEERLGKNKLQHLASCLHLIKVQGPSLSVVSRGFPFSTFHYYNSSRSLTHSLSFLYHTFTHTLSLISYLFLCRIFICLYQRIFIRKAISFFGNLSSHLPPAPHTHTHSGPRSFHFLTLPLFYYIYTTT